MGKRWGWYNLCQHDIKQLIRMMNMWCLLYLEKNAHTHTHTHTHTQTHARTHTHTHTYTHKHTHTHHTHHTHIYIYIYIYVVPSLSFKIFFVLALKYCRSLSKIQYVIAEHVMRWLDPLLRFQVQINSYSRNWNTPYGSLIVTAGEFQKCNLDGKTL